MSLAHYLGDENRDAYALNAKGMDFVPCDPVATAAGNCTTIGEWTLKMGSALQPLFKKYGVDICKDQRQTPPAPSPGPLFLPHVPPHHPAGWHHGRPYITMEVYGHALSLCLEDCFNRVFPALLSRILVTHTSSSFLRSD